MQASPLKRLRHVLEWGVLKLLFALARIVGYQRSSAALGAFARKFGPKLRKSNVAKRNLSLAFPQWEEAKLDAVIADMWENMGRYMGELPHIAPMTAEEFRNIAEIHGEDILHTATDNNKGALFFSAHMANWELGAKASWACGVPFAIVYRPLNNPLADKMTTAFRDKYQSQGLPKTGAGTRELLKTLRNGKPVAILIDQKMNTGVPVPFFGRDAMTATAIADLAIKFGYPIIPTRVERISNAPTHRITFEPPVEWEPSGDDKADALMIMGKLHDIMEGWIRERPGQWFWVHKRWG
ncbi:MAG: lysophospholipid acyltransferase family protein [Alphaproteobacteria bacterium]|nr:lysophospholipid acyltransferase family protein [Alphaproteobacteria bacterium]